MGETNNKNVDISNLNLEEAIHELFDFAHHNRIKEGMWMWLKATVCGNFNTELEEHERVFLLALYEKLGAVIDSANELETQNKTKQRSNVS